MILSILGGFQGTFSTFVSNIEAYPLILMRFLVPVILLLIATMAVQRVSKKEKVDSAPTIEQKMEQFTIPDDFFNQEMDYIRNDEYEHYLRPMGVEFRRLKEAFDQFKVLDKLYRKYDARTRSASKRRRKRALELRKEVFNQILELYNYIRRMKLSIVEYDESEKVNE